MELGTRRIRSAGHGTGSVEVTLPTRFRELVGVPLRVRLRDGLRPEIVLQPEIQAAHAALERLWAALAQATGLVAPPPFPAADFVFALFAPCEDAPEAPLRPGIAWSDAQVLSGAAPHSPVVVARLLRALGARLAAPLGVAAAQAYGFGAALAFAATGQVTRATEQQECDIAGAELGAAPGLAFNEAGEDAWAPALWAALAPGFARITDTHRQWTAEPALLARSRAAWRRGVTLELGGA